MQITLANRYLTASPLVGREGNYEKRSASQTANVVTQTPSTQVTISSAGQSLAYQSTESPSQEFRRITLEDAKLDPAFAERFTRDYAYDDSLEKGGPLVDISGYPSIRYTYTGEAVTDANLAEFKAEAGNARSGRIALYQSEKAKGTSDVEILELLFRYTDTQSDSYLSKLGWERAQATETA